MRLANQEEYELLVNWQMEMIRECGLENPTQSAEELRLECQRSIRSALQLGTRFVWDVDGQPVTMAAKTRSISVGTSISAVYTPPQFRKRGYASHLVAELSQQILDSGKPRCFLFTDAANPTSNAIYQQLGYQFMCRFRKILF